MNCIITGASRGLGWAMADGFAAAGYDLWLSSRNEAALEKAAKDLAKKYPSITVRHHAADIAERKGISSLADWLAGARVTPDILVNNAGSFIPGSVHGEPEGALESMMQVNLYSAYHLTRALLPGMMTRRQGHIFNVCSIASLQAYSNGGAYSISKFALAGFSKNLREEMKPFGIKVTAIYPGATYTDSWIGSGVDPQRIMESGDIARMVVAAASLSPQAAVEEILIRPQLGDL